MASYIDSALIQVLKDLQLKNPANGTLNPAHFTLTNPVADSSRAGKNTKATLTCINPAAGFTGSMDVYYTRLDLSSLYDNVSRLVQLSGAASQTTTRYALLDAMDPAISAGIKDEVDDLSVDVDRAGTIVSIAARAGSLKAIGLVNLIAQTIGADIGNFPSDVSELFFLDNEIALASDADIYQEVLDRIVVANGYAAGSLSKSDCSMTFYNGVTPDLALVSVTVNTPDLFYTGSRTFTYKRRNYLASFPGETTTYTFETDMYIILRNMFYGLNLQVPEVPTDMGHVMPEVVNTDTVLRPTWVDKYWNASDLASAPAMKITNSSTQQLQVVFDIALTSSNYVKFLDPTYDSLGSPLRFEVLSTNSGWTGGDILLDASGQTQEELFVGNYTLQLRLNDCRALKVNGVTTPIRFSQYCRMTRLRKLRGESFNGSFQGVTTLTTIDASCFSEDGANVADLTNAFYDCTGITSYPIGLLDTVIRCTHYEGMFSNTGITTLPSGMFKDLPAIFNGERTLPYLVRGTGVQTLPTGLFDNVKSFSFYRAFAYTGVRNLSAQVWKTAIKPTIAWSAGEAPDYPKPLISLEETFTNSNVINVHADTFAPLRDYGIVDVDLSSTFEECTLLQAVPETLFSNMNVATYANPFYNGAVAQFYRTFAGCTNLQTISTNVFRNTVEWVALAGTLQYTGINAIPDGMFQDAYSLKALTETFVGCPITTLPLDLFENCLSLTHTSGMFGACHSLTGLPATTSVGLLHDLGSLYDTSWMFSESGLTGFPLKLLTGATPYIQHATSMFESCTALQGDGASHLTEYNFSSSNAPSVYKGCTALGDYALLPSWAKT